MTLSKLIRAERKRLGLTQQELADRAGISGICISLYERGVTKPSLNTLRSLARVFGRSLDEMASAA
jgi:transcriptional regulator with XRE-family HTH domain